MVRALDALQTLPIGDAYGAAQEQRRLCEAGGSAREVLAGHAHRDDAQVAVSTPADAPDSESGLFDGRLI